VADHRVARRYATNGINKEVSESARKRDFGAEAKLGTGARGGRPTPGSRPRGPRRARGSRRSAHAGGRYGTGPAHLAPPAVLRAIILV
jgi:hypothetical protein